MIPSKNVAASPQQFLNRNAHRAPESGAHTAERTTAKDISTEVAIHLGYEISPAEVGDLIAGVPPQLLLPGQEVLARIERAVREARTPADVGYLNLLGEAREPVVANSFAFLDRVFRPGDVIELQAISSRGGSWSAFGRLGEPTERQRLEQFLAKHHGRSSIYVGINPRLDGLAERGETHRAANNDGVAARRHVVFDLDNKDAPTADPDWSQTLEALKALDPVAVVASGGGWHVWLPIEEVVGTDEVAASSPILAAAMAAMLADNMADPRRVIRVPGTINVPDMRKRRRGRTLAWSRIETPFNPQAKVRSVAELSDEIKAVAHRLALSGRRVGAANSALQRGVTGEAVNAGQVNLRAPRKEDVLRALARLPNDADNDDHFPTRNAEVAVAHAVRGSIIGTDFANDADIRDAFIEWAGIFGDDPEHAGKLYDGIRASRTGWPHLQAMVHQRVAAAAFEDNPLDAEQAAKLAAMPSTDHPGVEPWVAEINQRYAYVESLDRIADINRITGQVDKWLTPDQFRVRLDNQQGAGRNWLKNPRRRQHTSFGWWPSGQEPKDALNLWRGFPKETGLAADPDWRPLTSPLPDKLRPTLDFIDEVIASRRANVNEYVLNYLAWKVQNPTLRPGTALALVGASGTGKSTLGDMLADLFGAAHSRAISKPNQAVGQFNALLEGAMVVRLEEAFFGRDRSVRGAYKDMVTGAITNIERKGVDPIPMSNMAAIVVTSNEMSAIPHEAGERRTTFIKVSDAHRRDATYFGTLRGNWTSGGREAFLAFLLQRDVLSFNPRHALDTPEKAAASAENGDMPVQFWNDILESGTLPLMLNPDGSAPDWAGGPLTVPRSTLHTAYIRFVEARHGRAPHLEGVGELTRRLLDLCPGAREAQVRPGPNQPGVRSIIFPPLEECRAAFTRVLGGGG